MGHLMYDHMYNPPPVERSAHMVRLGIETYSKLSKEERRPFVSALRPKKAYDMHVQELLNQDVTYQEDLRNWRSKKLQNLLSGDNLSNEFRKLLSEYKRFPDTTNEIIFITWLDEIRKLVNEFTNI